MQARGAVVYTLYERNWEFKGILGEIPQWFLQRKYLKLKYDYMTLKAANMVVFQESYKNAAIW